MHLEIQYPDLKPLTAGCSFAQVISTLYYSHLLKYSTQDILKELGSWKIATKKKLQVLCDLGYLNKADEVFTSTAKTLELLVKNGYKPELLPPPAEGRGVEIYNSLQISKLILQEDFKVLLYPNFGYVIPDGLVVSQREDKYKLTFVEVEAKKPNWSDYLEDKRQKYERLARDEQAHQYWEFMSRFVALKCPRIEDFRFGVLCITSSEFRREWHGWRFARG